MPPRSGSWERVWPLTDPVLVSWLPDDNRPRSEVPVIADPYDPFDPMAATHALWAHWPGFAISCVTLDEATARARAAVVATAHRAPVAPGVWPLNRPADAVRLVPGLVYIASRTQRIHALARDVVTYYVLRRWGADEPTVSADPTSTVSAADAAQVPPSPAWPFRRVGHRVSVPTSSRGGEPS